VATDTPAARATSFIVAIIRSSRKRLRNPVSEARRRQGSRLPPHT
jgi:hypothetical protein